MNSSNIEFNILYRKLQRAKNVERTARLAHDEAMNALEDAKANLKRMLAQGNLDNLNRSKALRNKAEWEKRHADFLTDKSNGQK